MTRHTYLPVVRRAGAAAALAAALTLTAACGSSDHSSHDGASATHEAPDGSTYSDADVAFATGMIPHHAQAVQMVAMTDGRTLSPGLEKLAEQIRAAQTPEIETMADWLTAWGKKIPETSNDHANAGHDMDDMGDMPGMMSQSDLDEVSSATGRDFEQKWLTMMVEHHQGAVTMAEKEVRDGTFPDAVALARSIVSSQTAEIATMKGMLAAD
jgi:uncharacterized protein (DUF305 family)